MEKEDVLNIINGDIDIDVKLSTSKNALSKKVLETVCAFSNSDGGVILLGVGPDKEIVGVDKDSIKKVTRDLVKGAVNEKLMSPIVWLEPEVVDIDGKSVVCVHVPQSQNVTRYKNRFFVRGYMNNLDITDNEWAISNLFLRRNHFRFCDVVLEGVGLEAVDELSFKKMLEFVKGHKPSSAWLEMSMQELLQIMGLIKANGITVACLLLFGKEAEIMRLMPEYGVNVIVEHGDNKEGEFFSIKTNLIEAYQTIMDIAKRHIKDKLIEDNPLDVMSVRDRFLNEVIVNMLRHNDYSAPRKSSVIIGDDKLTTENVNSKRFLFSQTKCEGQYSSAWCKNPRLELAFMGMGLAGAFGLGCRNIERYSEMYSGKPAVFDNGYLFRVTIPLK